MNTISLVAGFVKSLAGRHTDDDGHADCRVAAMALMYHVIRTDGAVGRAERKVFDQTVQRYFDSEGADIKALSSKAQQAYRESTDVYQFAQVLQRQLTKNECEAFISILWQLGYADGTIDELEQNLIERIAEILQVENPSSLKLPEQNALLFQRRMNN